MEKTMYILTYDHGGYVLWGDKVRDRLASAVEWLEKYPKFKIGLDFEAFTFDELERRDPDINRTIGELLKKYPGRFGLGSSTYGQPLSLFISEESNVRQLSYAIRSNLRHFGCTPTVYAISEFALNNQTPQLLRLCGYEAAIFRTHVMNYGYQKPFDAAWGLWVGKDGSGIPAVPTYPEQGVGYCNTTLDNWVLTRWPGDSEYSLEDFEKKFNKYEPLLASRYDDLTLRKEELVAHAEEKDNYRFVLLEELPGIFGRPNEKLVTDDNDFHGRMPWGYCGNEIFNGCRAAETNAALAERANALSVMLGGKALQEDLESAWKNALIAQHHDVTICGLLDEARRFIPDSLSASRAAKTASLESIGARFARPDTDGVLAFNTASFPVSQWIETDARGNSSAFDGEKALPCELCGDKLRIFVQLNALTAKRIALKKGGSAAPCPGFSYDAASGVLETPLWRFVLNEKGIVSFTDKKSGRLIADNGEGALFRGWTQEGDLASLGQWSVRISARSVSAVQNGRVGSIPFRFEMKISEGLNRIECASSFELHNDLVGRTGVSKGIHSPFTVNGFVHEEKLRFVINLCLDEDRRMFRDLPFSIAEWNGQIPVPEDFWYEGSKVLVDHEVPPEESGVNPTYLQGIYWLSLRDKNGGLAVFNRGCMGSAVEGNRLSLPLIYSNEYMCGTRILDGEFTSEFALFPFCAETTEAGVHRSALSYEYPVLSHDIARGSGDLEELRAADFSSDSEAVILTALYPEDGAVFARFCNYSNEEASAAFSPCAGRAEAEVDLLAREISPADGKSIVFRPWEIKTLRIDIK